MPMGLLKLKLRYFVIQKHWGFGKPIYFWIWKLKCFWKWMPIYSLTPMRLAIERLKYWPMDLKKSMPTWKHLGFEKQICFWIYWRICWLILRHWATEKPRYSWKYF